MGRDSTSGHDFAVRGHRGIERARGGPYGMTKLELIDAYAAGRVDRRDFVARLTGFGISAAAALAYAQSFAPSASAASSRGRNGYVVRMQDSSSDNEYGAPIGICPALDVLIDVTQRMIDRLASMTSLNNGLRNVMNRMQQRLELLQELETTFCESASTGSLARGVVTRLAQNSNSEKQAREDLITYAATVVCMYTSIVPTVDDIEHRTSLTSIAMAISHEVANIRRIVGEDMSEE